MTKFGSWISASEMKQFFFWFCLDVRYCSIFFCHGQHSPNVTQSGNSNALWLGTCDMLPAGRVVFGFLSVWVVLQSITGSYVVPFFP